MVFDRIIVLMQYDLRGSYIFIVIGLFGLSAGVYLVWRDHTLPGVILTLIGLFLGAAGVVSSVKSIKSSKTGIDVDGEAAVSVLGIIVWIFRLFTNLK